MWQKFKVWLKNIQLNPTTRNGEQAFLDWADTANGRAFVSQQRKAIEESLASVSCGYHFLTLGPAVEPVIAKAQNCEHLFGLDHLGSKTCQAQVNYHELPLPTGLIDTILLYHVLEFSEVPHAALYEAARSLMPSGYMVIVTFNPWSLYGLWAGIRGVCSTKAIWQRQMLSKNRLKDWLKLLNMQVVDETTNGYLLPKKWDKYLEKHAFFQSIKNKKQLPLAAYHIIVAKKLVSRPIKPNGLSWNVITKQKVASPQSRAQHQELKDIH